MNLRLVWHIFRKDARRLWWLIALTLALLARLYHFDSVRSFAVPGIDEGWLNVLQPLAWSLLIALAVLQDPVAGDTPFWATLPCRWPSLLAAKALFIAAAIHLPYFIASAGILYARGFAPVDYLPDLLYQQFALLALTLGSLALATLVRNVTQFMVVAVAMTTAVAAPSMGWNQDPPAIHHVRELLGFPVVVIAGACIAMVQYASRRNLVARVSGLAAIAIVAIIWWMPRDRIYGIQAAMSPAPASVGTPSMQLARGLEPPDTLRGRLLPLHFDKASIAVPILVSGLRDNARVRFPQTGPVLVEPSGNRVEAEPTSLQRGMNPCCGNLIPSWQILSIAPAAYERIRNEQVILQGRFFVDYYRPTAPVAVTIGNSVAIAGVAICSVDIPVRDDPNFEGLRVECESPNPLPPIEVTLSDANGNREWKQYLGSSMTLMSYPSGAWLSPMDRRETTFAFTDEQHYNAFGGKWLVPRDVVQSVRITVTAELPEGIRVVDYSIPGIRPVDYQVKQ
jgi:hypothetical protein